MTVDASVCRDSLDKLINAEVNALDSLEQLLQREHDVICRNDIDQLEHTGEARQEAFAELSRIQDERHSLCRMLNVPQDRHGLERLLTWCDPSHELQRKWGSCADAATRCRDLNEKNGALVTARLKRVEGMLNVLTGRPTQAPLYGANGNAQHANAGRMVATKV